jgi:hypothetical protein
MIKERQEQERELKSRMYTGGDKSPLIIKMSLALWPPITPLSKEEGVRESGSRWVSWTKEVRGCKVWWDEEDPVVVLDRRPEELDGPTICPLDNNVRGKPDW